MLDEVEVLADGHVVSSIATADPIKRSPFRSRPNSFQPRMPLSFEDPLGEEQRTRLNDLDPLAQWTQESLHGFEERLSQQFGQKYSPQLLSTGTTIAGVCGYDDNGRPFVVLGADTRATAGRMVADKRCSKIHCLASNMWCCGAGTSADLDHITRRCRYTLAMQSLLEKESIGNKPRQWKSINGETVDPHLESTADHSASMASVCRFFRNTLYEGGGNIGANLIAGGVDEGTGIPHIRAIHPHGSMDPLPYAALGSGGLAAMAVIESRYRRNISLNEGIEIVKGAILSGIENDMGSGSQVDLCIITGGAKEAGEEVIVVSNYTRAVVPEQELVKVEDKEFTVSSGTESLPLQKAAKSSIPGVNGFGCVPFFIRSKRLVVESRDVAEEQRLDEWDTLLGIKGQN